MSPPKDCFAICTPQQTDPHDSMYLSLFGRDLLPGRAVRSRSRLLVGLKPKEASLIKAYQDYVSGR
jgi:hypothetical protein